MSDQQGLLASSYAAAGLLALATTPDRAQYMSPLVSRRNSAETPPEKCSSKADGDDEKTPARRQFVLTGVKRTRDPDMLSVVYSCGQSSMAVPLMKNDSTDTFYARRRVAADMLFDESRADVFCSWRDTLVNILVDDGRWVKFRETFREQRFAYKNLQLVVLRYTCAKGETDYCVNCATPSRRLSCMMPTRYYYVMPLPSVDCSDKNADATLDDFDPVDVRKDTESWRLRIPSLHVRS